MANDATGMGGPPNGDEAFRGLKASEFVAAGRSQEISPAEVSRKVSLALNLPVQDAEVMKFASEMHGVINGNPLLLDQARRGGNLGSFILSQAPPDIVAKLDPARRAEAERQRMLHTANRSGSEFAGALSHFGGHGQWASSRGNDRARNGDGGSGGSSGGREASGAGYGGASGRSDYGGMSLASPHSVTQAGFGNTPYARQGGLDYPTFNYVRNFDKKFTGGDILDAAKHAKELGFSPHDPKIVAHQALIEHYDPKKKETFKHLKDFKGGLRHSEEFKAAAKEHAAAKTPEAKAAAEKKMQAAIEHEAKKSGLHHDEHDKSKPEQARRGIRYMKGASVRDEYRHHTGKNLKLQHDGSQPARASKPDKRAEAKPVSDKGIRAADNSGDGQKNDFLAAGAKPSEPKKVAENEPSKKADKPTGIIKSAAKASPSPTMA